MIFKSIITLWAKSFMIIPCPIKRYLKVILFIPGINFAIIHKQIRQDFWISISFPVFLDQLKWTHILVIFRLSQIGNTRSQTIALREYTGLISFRDSGVLFHHIWLGTHGALICLPHF